MTNRVILISIKPEYSRKILDGSKTIELRRKIGKIPPGSVALIYESAPTSAIVGEMAISDVAEMAPEKLWRSYGKSAGVPRTKFREYFANAAVAFGLIIGSYTQYENPIPLATMREEIGVQPPQSYRYLNPDLVGLVHAATGATRHKHRNSG